MMNLKNILLVALFVGLSCATLLLCIDDKNSNATFSTPVISGSYAGQMALPTYQNTPFPSVKAPMVASAARGGNTLGKASGGTSFAPQSSPVMSFSSKGFTSGVGGMGITASAASNSSVKHQSATGSGMGMASISSHTGGSFATPNNAPVYGVGATIDQVGTLMGARGDEDDEEEDPDKPGGGDGGGGVQLPVGDAAGYLLLLLLCYAALRAKQRLRVKKA